MKTGRCARRTRTPKGVRSVRSTIDEDGVAAAPSLSSRPSVADDTWRSTGPGSPERASRSPSSTATPGSEYRSASITPFTNGAAIEASGNSCCRKYRPLGLLVGVPAMCRSGTESNRASAKPVSAQVKPGPEIVSSTPVPPVTLAQPPAMKAALNSFVAITVRRPLCRSASKSSTVGVPGNPKTQRAPPCWSAWTIREAPVCHFTRGYTHARDEGRQPQDTKDLVDSAQRSISGSADRTRIGDSRKLPTRQQPQPRRWMV